MAATFTYQFAGEKDTNLTLRFDGRLDAESSPKLLEDLSRLIENNSPHSVSVDLENVSYLDDYGALILFELKQWITRKNGGFEIERIQKDAKAYLSYLNFDKLEKTVPKKQKRSFNLFVRLGQSAICDVVGLKYIVTFLGSVIIAFFRVLIRPRILRLGDTLTYMEKSGVEALPIVALISALLGLVIAFMSSIQFQQFGASVYTASLVSFAMVSELGPIMTAIVVSGRSGSSFAAEIGTMQISEEIDALQTMGFDPVQFLAIPRIIALVIVLPVLTLFSDVFGIAGGMVVGVFMIDLSVNTYISYTMKVLTLFELSWSMMKTVIFAVLISTTGCLRGFQARGGASAVGNAATSAVVSSIFLIIFFDSMFAIIRSYWY